MLEVRAAEAYAAGEECFISYGDYGNAELLAGYGFAWRVGARPVG